MPVWQSPAIEIYNEKDKNDDLEWQPLLVSAPVNPKQQQMQITSCKAKHRNVAQMGQAHESPNQMMSHGQHDAS